MPLVSQRRNSSWLLAVLLVQITMQIISVSSFQANMVRARTFLLRSSTTCHALSEDQVSDFERPGTFLDEDEEDDGGINIVFINEDDEAAEEEEETKKPKGQGRQRWENLKPAVKKRLIEEGQAKAIANKKKREPAAEKKRRESQTHHWFRFSQ